MMEHWTAAYLGRRYIEGEHDCADFALAVMRDRFGRSVDLPPHAAGLRGRDRQLIRNVAEIGVRLPLADARDGDAVLMRAAGRAHTLGHHIGVYVEHETGPHTLHCLAGGVSCLTALRELDRIGLVLAGIYRWRDE